MCALSAALLVTACSVVLGMEPSYELASADASVPPAEASCPNGVCRECVPGDFRCIGVDLQHCEGGVFRHLETCEVADKCSGTGGNCQGLYCLPGQRRCSGDRLERCNATQTAFELEIECGVGLCDAPQKRCNTCVANAPVACLDTKTLVSCSADGKTTTNVACPAATPNCSSGPTGTACIACSVDAHCSTTEPCRAPKCTNGTCGSVADVAQEGRVLVPAPAGSCLQKVCRNGAAKDEYLPSGTKCDEGQQAFYFCDAAGVCVESTM